MKLLPIFALILVLVAVAWAEAAEEPKVPVSGEVGEGKAVEGDRQSRTWWRYGWGYGYPYGGYGGYYGYPYGGYGGYPGYYGGYWG